MKDKNEFAELSAQDQAAAQLLLNAFGSVEMKKEVVTSDATSTNVVPLVQKSTRFGIKLNRWIAVAAAGVIGAVALNVTGPAAPSMAWSPEPRSISQTETSHIGDVCADVVRKDIGALPPLVALDVRGTGGVGIYQDFEQQVVCFLRSADDRWEAFGVSVGTATDVLPVGLISSGGTSTTDGQSVNFVTGAVPPGTKKVTFELTDGRLVTASVYGTTFAAWFEGDVGFAPGTEKFE